MAGHGSPRGVRQGGRQKGTPNQVTADAREAFRLVFESLAPEAEGWIRAAAKKNPAKGAELFLKLAEHFVPKVSRHELTGRDGNDLFANLTDEQLEAKLQALRARVLAEEAENPTPGMPYTVRAE